MENKLIPMDCSVIICSHNPRVDYLTRVLDSLRSQTLEKEHWELLLIDNASDTILVDSVDLSWHPNSRNVREDKLGLTSARLRGIKESSGGVLVFVDDDNVLKPDYLEISQTIADEFPFLGAWGGSSIGVFETPPPDWARAYLSCLAIREIKEDLWSNDPENYRALPAGAGLCVRRRVAEAYAVLVNSDPLRRILDRQGNNLLGGGDMDLAYTACTQELGFGVFHNLALFHLIPSSRLTLQYLTRLVEGSTASKMLLDHLRSRSSIRSRYGVRDLVRTLYNRIALSREEWALYKAQTGAWRLYQSTLKEFTRLQSTAQTE
jgi:glycosyltransferase involved in cell wall biosynthesis